MYDQHTDPENTESSNEVSLNDSPIWEENNKTHILEKDKDRKNHRERLLPHTLKLQVEKEGTTPVCYKDNTGYKLFAAEAIIIEPGAVKLVNTAVTIELIPNNPEIKIDIQIESIYEIEEKHLYIVNNPGTIDMDYRGHIKVILWNYSENTVTINPGDAIAKLGFYKRIKGNIVTLKGEANYE